MEWGGGAEVSSHDSIHKAKKTGGGPHHMQDHHTWGLGIGLRKLVFFDFEYSSNIQLSLKIDFFLFVHMFSPEASMNIFFAINHIAIYMCNSLKCWFKHPLPN